MKREEPALGQSLDTMSPSEQGVVPVSGNISQAPPNTHKGKQVCEWQPILLEDSKVSG